MSVTIMGSADTRPFLSDSMDNGLHGFNPDDFIDPHLGMDVDSLDDPTNNKKYASSAWSGSYFAELNCDFLEDLPQVLEDSEIEGSSKRTSINSSDSAALGLALQIKSETPVRSPLASGHINSQRQLSPESTGSSVGNVSETVTRKSNAQDPDANITAPGSGKPKKRTRRPKQQHNKDKPPTGEVGGKRDKFLERNRVAASKCRQKRKEWMHNLEDRKQEVENLNLHLHREFHALTEEVGRLKTMLMDHVQCHDENIGRWIEGEARRIVHQVDPLSEGTPTSADGAAHDGSSSGKAPQPNRVAKSAASLCDT